MKNNRFEAALNSPPSQPATPKASKPKPSRECTKQQRWEHRVVTKILEHCGLSDQAWPLARVAYERTGLWWLSFAILDAVYPIPAWLVCRKVPWVHRISIADLQRRFTKTRLFRAFANAEADASAAYRDGRVGLVFEWVGVWPMAVIHNCASAIPTDEPAIVRSWPNVEPPQVVAIQSFDSFLRTLVKRGSPDEPMTGTAT